MYNEILLNNLDPLLCTFVILLTFFILTNYIIHNVINVENNLGKFIGYHTIKNYILVNLKIIRMIVYFVIFSS